MVEVHWKRKKLAIRQEAFRYYVLKSFNLQQKKSFVKAMVWSVALYRCETWTLRKEKISGLGTFEM